MDANSRGTWIGTLQRYQGFAGLILLLAVAFLLDRDFFTGANWSNILNQLAIPGTLAVGMTFVILTGGIDLSVGAHLALLNCITATWIKSGTGLAPTAAYVLAVGTLVGALLGLLVSKLRLQAFVVTLAAMVSLRGISYIYTNNGNVSGLGATLKPLTESAGLPIAAWLAITVTSIGAILLSKTVFGRRVYAIGGNENAARTSGVPVATTRVLAYAINGFCVALAAVLFTARTNNGQPSAAMGYELDAIAAVVVGGSSLMGGYGHVLGSFVGAMFIVCLNVLLILQSVNEYVGMGWKGIIILIAVYLQNLGRR